VRDLGLRRSIELADSVLRDTIRIRYALMLPEVLEPGCDLECIQETSAVVLASTPTTDR
jgi:hypothetical protein